MCPRSALAECFSVMRAKDRYRAGGGGWEREGGEGRKERWREEEKPELRIARDAARDGGRDGDEEFYGRARRPAGLNCIN